MKKILCLTIVALLILAASIFWIWRAMGVTDAARLLPPNTVLMVSLPDLPRTATRWPQTTLAKIGAEPEVKDFLKKPLEFLMNKNGGEEAYQILERLKPGRIFFAVTSVSPQDMSMLIGFQFWGSKQNYDSAISRLRTELQRNQQAQEVKRDVHNGVEILSTKYDTHVVFSAAVGHWGFLSNNLETIQQAIDRASDKLKDNSLADQTLFTKVISQLPSNPDTVFFCQPQLLLDTLLAVGQSMGAQQIPDQIEQLKKTQAIGFSMKLDGPDLRETIFILRPDPPAAGNLSHTAIKLTTADTLAYLDFIANLSQFTQPGINPVMASLVQSPTFQNSRIFQLIPEAFSSECALAATWAPSQMKPEVLFAIQVKDAAKASEWLREITTLFPETVIAERNGVNYYSFPSLQNVFASPTIALSDGFLLAGLNMTELERVIATGQNANTLENSPKFVSARKLYNSANEVFGYIDTGSIFTRGYDALKPIITFGAAFVPGAAEFLDSTKLPPTETIAKHLQPILYAQTRKPDGYLIESSGPITWHQALVAVIGGVYFTYRPSAPQQ